MIRNKRREGQAESARQRCAWWWSLPLVCPARQAPSQGETWRSFCRPPRQTLQPLWVGCQMRETNPFRREYSTAIYGENDWDACIIYYSHNNFSLEVTMAKIAFLGMGIMGKGMA